MTQYKCIRCGYSTNHKGTFIRHIERVRRCKAIHKDVGKNEIYKHNRLFDKISEKSEITQNCQHNVNIMSTSTQLSTLCQHEEKCQHNVNIMSTLNEDNVNIMSTLNEDIVNIMSTSCQHSPKSVNIMSTLNEDKLVENNIEKKKKKIYKCKYCGKDFNTRQSKSRHEKGYCHLKKSASVITNEHLLKQLEEKDKQINALIENVNDTLPYQNTNRQFLTDDMISKCMERQNRCIPEIIKLVHFNNQYPENRNLYIRNLKTGYILTYNGNDWILNDRKVMMDKIISDNEKFMHTKFMEWYEDDGKKTKYKKALSKFEKYLTNSSNQHLLNNVKEELKLMLYNIKNKIGTNNYVVTELKEN